jgi:hypothetical protein
MRAETSGTVVCFGSVVGTKFIERKVFTFNNAVQE